MAPKSKRTSNLEKSGTRNQSAERLAYLANLLDNISDALISTDMEFKVLEWNAAAENMYGWKAAEVLGHPAGEFILTEYLVTTRDEVIQGVLGTGVWKGEATQNRRDGTRFPVMVSISLVKDETGEPIGFVTVNRDVTERKQIDEQLRQSQERFSKAFHSTPTALVLSRLSDSKFESVNESFLNMVDYQLEDVIGKSPAELNLFPNPDQLAGIRQTLIETKKVRNIETTVRTGKGEIRHVLFAVDIIQLNQQPYSLTTMIDITERILAEKKVIQMKRLYATLSQVNQTIVRVQSRGDLYQSICDVALKFGELSIAWVGLLDETTGDVQPVAASGMNVDITHWPFPIININKQPPLNGVIVEALHTSNTSTSDDVQTDERTKALHDVVQRFGFHSLAAVPFRLRGKTLGVLAMVSIEPGIFNAEEERKLLDEMGLDISFALDTMETEAERKRAEEKVERQNQRLKILREIDVAILAADSVEAIVGAALTYTRELIGCRRASLTLFDWDKQEAMLFDVKTAGETSNPKAMRAPLAPYQEMIKVFLKNEPLVINDLGVVTDPPPALQKTIQAGFRSLCSLPLFSQGSLIGTFGMASDTPGFFDDQIISLAREVANQVSIAITQTNLLNALRKINAELEQRIIEREQAEERFRSTFEQAAVGIAQVGPDGRWLRVNQRLCDIVGFTRDELITKTFQDITHPDDLDADLELVQQVLDDKIKTYSMEKRYFRKDGSLIWINLTVSLIRQSTGEPNYFISVVQDITERKRAEDNLNRSQERFSRAFLSSPAGLAISSLENGRFIDANESYLNMIEYQREEVIGHTSTELNLISMEERARYIAQLRQQGKLQNFEMQLRAKSGRLVQMLFSTQQIELDGNAYLLSTTIDITERKRMEEEVQRQLERLRALREVDSAIVGCVDMSLPLRKILEQVTLLLRVDAADILLFDSSTLTLKYAAARGFRSKAIERSELRLGQGIAGRVALERVAQHIQELSANHEFTRASLLAGEGFIEFFVVPLIAKGNIVGVMELFHRQSLDTDQNWLDFLHTLAGQAAVAIDNHQLFNGIQRANIKLLQAYDTTIEGWSRALDLRDKETEGHTLRVTETTIKLARAAGMSEAELINVRRGALLHDIGKMGVPDHILLKPGNLTDEEWVAMRKHPTFAFELLSPIAYLQDALDIPYCHHEKWDGTGYPRGLKGEQIPLAARLFAIVDVWDALRSDRPYRPAWSKEKTVEHIKSHSGTHFDPKALELFLKLLNGKD